MVDMIATLRYHRRRAAHAECRDVVPVYLGHHTVPAEGVSTQEALLQEEHLPRRQRIREEPAERPETCQRTERAEITNTLLIQLGGAGGGV